MSMQTDEGRARSEAEYAAAQAANAEAMKSCRHCKSARTRSDGRKDGCREHLARRRLNFACSPVSEAYWCS